MNKSAVIWIAILASPTSTLIADDQVVTIRHYVDAYNLHDVDTMMTYVSEDIRWISESESSVVVETSGKKELIAVLTSYFSRLPSARSEISNFSREDEMTFVEETAFWMSEGKLLSQCAVASYEFIDRKIANVTYYSNRQCAGFDASGDTIQREEPY